MKESIFAWQNLTPTTLDEAIERMPLAWVPVGQLEWHGEQNPLGCDIIRGEAICLRSAEKAGGVVLPPLYTTAPGFSAYRGTICFSPRLVKSLVAELLRELEKCGFRAALFVLGHGGPAQVEAFTEPAEAFAQEHDFKVLVTHGLEFMPPDCDFWDGHAQAGETSQYEAAQPGIVDLSRFQGGTVPLPRYPGLDPATYYDGLSEEQHESVRQHIARTEWTWHPDFEKNYDPQRGQRQLEAIAEVLADKARELLVSIDGHDR